MRFLSWREPPGSSFVASVSASAMRIAFKLSVVLLPAICIIFAVGGYVAVRRELLFFETGATRDKIIYGRPLAAALEEVWRTSGEAVALDMVTHANDPGNPVGVRWVWLDSAAELSKTPSVPNEQLAALESGDILSGLRVPGDDRVFTYIPVRAPDGRVGALELWDNLGEQRLFARNTIYLFVSVFALMALMASGLALTFGVLLVGRPVRALVDKARQTALGDFSSPVRLTSKDEFAVVAQEMNAMCKKLAEAAAEIKAETDARILALEQLRHAERLATVGKLAAGMAHELGTALNVVMGRAQLLGRDEPVESPAGMNSRIIHEQAKRMTDIIQQLLNFARRHAPRTKTVRVQDMLHATWQLLNPLAAEHRVDLQIEVAPTSLVVNVDLNGLQQVLANVVTNAIHAAAEGGSVELRAKRDDMLRPANLGGGNETVVTIVVRDDGVGISEENLKRVFEPFFTTKEVGKGTGLGLSMAHGIVRDHEGWITVESKQGKGATFTICLPNGGQQ